MGFCCFRSWFLLVQGCVPIIVEKASSVWVSMESCLESRLVLCQPVLCCASLSSGTCQRDPLTFLRAWQCHLKTVLCWYRGEKKRIKMLLNMEIVRCHLINPHPLQSMNTSPLRASPGQWGSPAWCWGTGAELWIEPYVVKLIKGLGKHKSSVCWLLAQVHNFLAIGGEQTASVQLLYCELMKNPQ